MTVQITNAFRARFIAIGVNPDKFIEVFAEYKSGPPLGDLLFGKDEGYHAPKVDGVPLVLRHVHMIPQDDVEEVRQWRENYKYGRQKTSDRALVYVTNAKGDHLLMGILEEPGAHEVCKMKTPEDAALMKKFAIIAAVFLKTGKVSC